ncbi:MAG: pitrilysin family protein, partial [Deltaproteobacteria bacterium]
HVLLVERHDLPIVAVQAVTRRGGDDAPVTRAGLASLVGVLLETGTTSRSSMEVSDAYAALGAEHATWMSWDSGGASVKVLAPNLEPALGVMADVVLHPAFAPDEIDRARARRLAALQQEVDSPRTLAANLAVRTVYGETHPYGRSLTGTEETVRAITRDDILRFYQSHFVPADCALVVVGDVTRATVTPMLQHAFGDWHARAAAPRPPARPAPFRPGARIFLTDRPHAPQSAVLLAHAGVPRTSRDYAPLVVMNSILGGMFSSRINLNLREAHAYTYGAGSSFTFRHGAGPFTVGGAIVTANTADAVHEILVEMARMRGEDVTPDELAAARARITESLPARFETTDQTAAAMSELYTYELPLDEFATITARINAVTQADVRRVAGQYLDPDHARIIVVGDRETVEPALRRLGLGDVEARDVHGNAPPAASPAPSAPTPSPAR